MIYNLVAHDFKEGVRVSTSFVLVEGESTEDVNVTHLRRLKSIFGLALIYYKNIL